MPLDPMKVSLAIAGGLSTVCATCDNFWQARERGIPGDSCLAVAGCGSPIAGDVFTEYLGPISDFSKFCFVCGNKGTHALKVAGKDRAIGCCAAHVDLVKKLKPADKPAVNVIVISKDGTRSTEEMEKDKSPLVLKLSNG